MELIDGSRKARVLVRNRLQSENVELLSQPDALTLGSLDKELRVLT